MTFRDTLNTHFSGAQEEREFVRRTYHTLESYGFDGPNTIACVAVCRDEITRPFVDAVQCVWGEAFNFGSLAGMLFLGRTGFRAALHHAPVVEGCRRMVFYAMPHIAISTDGDIGTCYRRGIAEPSMACGALVALQAQLQSGDGHDDVEIERVDVEQSLLRQRLADRLQPGLVPDLVAMTRLTHQAIREDLDLLIDSCLDPTTTDYAIFTGIQVHGPHQASFIWPADSRAVIRGTHYDV